MLRDLFSTAEIAACFDDDALLGAMLAFERALARAEGACGAIPASAAQRIDALAADAKLDATLLVAEARVLERSRFLFSIDRASEALRRRRVPGMCTGADQPDVSDRLFRCVQLRLAPASRAGTISATRSRRGDAHRGTLRRANAAATGDPGPFGFKWPWAGRRRAHAGALRRVCDVSAAVRGASSAGAARFSGPQVALRLAHELGLTIAATPWHAVRDDVVRIGAEVGIACEVNAKLAIDIALLMQPEIGEAFEPAGAGRGASSAMPHKRNPVGAMFAREAGLRAPGLVANLVGGVAGEHERGLGQWQSQFWTLGELFAAAASGVDAMIEVITGLQIDATAMRRNLDALHGFVYAEALAMALAATLGKVDAHARVEALCRDAQSRNETLQQALQHDSGLAKLLPPDVVARAFEPTTQFGAAATMIDGALDAWRNRKADMPFLLRDGARLWCAATATKPDRRCCSPTRWAPT